MSGGNKVLIVASEAYPLVKTGGLGDVIGALARALQGVGVDARLVLPAYPEARQAAQQLRRVSTLILNEQEAVLWQGRLPGTRVPLWLVDVPEYFDRPGGPYADAQGQDWPDNAQRFALFCRIAAALARGRAGVAWQPDVVHCHDWQTGLVPALLAEHAPRPATVFTIHNLAYRGLFAATTRHELALPERLWSTHGLEFHGDLCLIKGGLAFADRVTTVSPTYAREIQRPELGEGLDGLLRHRAGVLTGILNGIDSKVWNPSRDTHLSARYSRQRMDGKARNKTALQAELGLPAAAERPLAIFIGRLVAQKGVDLILSTVADWVASGGQLALLGTGDAVLEARLRQIAARHPAAVAARHGFDEGLAHRMQAGADLLLMPSRFEPCGLNQLYALAYGTVPVVHAVGGLADTVVGVRGGVAEAATGFTFASATAAALAGALRQALACFADRDNWSRLRDNGMAQDFSWRHSAASYARLYAAVAPPA